MQVNIVIGVVTIFCTLVAADSLVRDSRQAGRYGPNYGGINYGPGQASRPSSQSVIQGAGSRPSLSSGYGIGAPIGRPASGPVFGVSSSGGRPSVQGGGPRPGPVYRGPPINSAGRPVNSYKG